MALKAKQPHIRIDDRIWDDPVIINLSGGAFRSWLFAIAWSKSQGGRTPDGLLTDHGVSRISATQEDLDELVTCKLLEKCNGGYKISKYEQWQVTAKEEQEAQAHSHQQAEYGKQGAAKRWSKADPPPVEEGFDVDKAFEEAWGEWPEPSAPKFKEKREQAYEAFRANITNSKDFTSFSAALMKRIKDYNAEAKPKPERRMYLGAFKNFCDGRWKDWIPKSHTMYAEPVPVETAPVVQEEVPSSSGTLTLDQQMDQDMRKLGLIA